MVVTVQSGSTAVISAGQTVKSPTVKNAGTVTNAGTIQQSKSNVATGTGSGVGSAITQFKQLSVATGTGSGLGSAVTQFKRLPIANGTGSGLGSAVSQRQTARLATGLGLGVGSAVSQPNISRIATGLGLGLGSAITQFKRFPVAAGSGLGAGSATTQFKRFPVATGSGLSVGGATTNRFEQISALGIGSGFGSAVNPVPFDPITQIVRLLDATNEAAWRYGKPERIAPIWEYSHNDRVNYPDPALYIYTPADSVVDKFGIEGDNFNQTITIEILIMTLESSETQGYVGDTTTLITQLYDDNAKNSNFHRFSNVNAADLRNEHITQQTDHYLASVTFEIQRFTDIADLQEVGAFR